MKSASSSDAKAATGTQAIDRALALLFAFTRDRPERRIQDLSEEFGLHKATVHRLLQALAATGLIRQEITGAYRLGGAVLDLASRFIDSIDLRNVARPYIEALAKEEGETVNLAILDGTEAILIDRVIGLRTPQLVSRFATRMPIYCSATGKGLILDMDETQVRGLLRDTDFVRLTDRTIGNIDAFVARFHVWKEQGWAYNDEESEIGLRAVAAPVRNHTRAVVATVGISAPTFRMAQERLDGLSKAVQRTARSISIGLGAPVKPD
jgi:DNA-binding IclR family transcriptional regulator